MSRIFKGVVPETETTEVHPCRPTADSSDHRRPLIRTRRLHRAVDKIRDSPQTPNSTTTTTKTTPNPASIECDHRPSHHQHDPLQASMVSVDSWHATGFVSDTELHPEHISEHTSQTSIDQCASPDDKPRQRKQGLVDTRHTASLLAAGPECSAIDPEDPSASPKPADSFCEVCWQLTTDPVGCEGCAHRYCSTCLSRYWTSEIFAGRHARIQCMYGLCVAATDEDIRRVVSERAYLKMKYFISRDRLANQDNVVWCVKDMCWAPITASKSALRKKDPVTSSVCVQCDKCQTKTCFDCGEPWHPGVKCPRVNNKDGARGAASRAWTRLHTKPCPQCKVRIQKNDGCRHMNCTRCNASFCWRCGGYSGQNGRRACRCDVVLTGLVYTTIAALVLVGSPVIVASAVVAGPPYGVYKVYSIRKERKNARLEKEDNDLEKDSSRQRTSSLCSLNRPSRNRFQ